MAVGVVADIDDVVIARAQIADQRWAHRKAILVRFDVAALAIGVPGEADLAGEADERKILMVDIRVQHPILARALRHIVEAAVGVLLKPPDADQIILEAVVVAVAEQPDRELLVVEQETAEIELQRLDADPNAIEIVARRHVAQMIIDESFLHAHEVVEARSALGRLHE